ncbi:hypothetical protein BgiBS90_028218 [Biomphalaria glabrata]|nr:hypothetical protein BgiBS90_028218 [Biomphalaria glabrata]
MQTHQYTPVRRLKSWNAAVMYRKQWDVDLWTQRILTKEKVFEEDGKHYKGMGGVKRLTQAAILRIQGHYGGAIRNNTNNLLQMKKAIWAIWKHRCGDHSDCGHWCPKEQNIAVANKNKLPKYITDAMKPIFEELSDALLQKCLHGGMQNANELFHNLIWKRCPKNQFVGRKRLEIAVHDATIVYDGELGRRQIFPLLGLQFGYYAETSFRTEDKKRI